MKTGALVYTRSMAISFLGGWSFILALAAGVVRPWRGLFLLWALGVFYGSTGLAPGLTPPYIAVVTAAGAGLLAAGEHLLARCRRHGRRTITGGQLLLGSSSAFLLLGLFLGPLWGLVGGGGLGVLGAACFYRRDRLSGIVFGLIPLLLRCTGLLLMGFLLNGRLLGLF
ncbi:hypothetical protein MTY_0141 [Moorella thermoacetica Y72]|uniref:Uncharacterized protein n=1 Tax=Moorella thermoacetica Y72 TaxID=1325331 RepID=A0A0S6U9G0_NEOTH|nr:hypothetical protein [Moorella thermoacetica]GAF24813.1 hypothetical protein MTY_0141 [Moorella thermoacetica Y72]